MRFGRIITGVMLVILLMFVVGIRDSGQSLDKTIEGLSGVEPVFESLTHQFDYVSPYKADLTVGEAIGNVIHGFMYSAYVEGNTFIAFTTIYAYKYLGSEPVVVIFKLILLMMLIWVISHSIVPVGGIYVFMEDWLKEKKIKVNKFLLLGGAIIIWILIVAIILGIIFLF